MKIRKEDIIPDPNQPRLTFDEEKLAGLRVSMNGREPDQPLIVRPIGEGKYMIVTGERRWRACEAEEIECVVRVLNDREALETQFREDQQHEDIGKIELGKALHEYMAEYGATQGAVAKLIGKTDTDVSKYISVSLHLSVPCKELYSEGRLNDYAAWQISTIPGSEMQLEIAIAIIENSLDVNQVRWLVQEAKAHPLKPISEVTQKAIEGKDSARADKAISNIPEPERKEETRRALDAYNVDSRLAPEVAKRVISQPEHSPQEIIEEIQEAESANKRLAGARKGAESSGFSTMVTRQMEIMTNRLKEFDSLPTENPEKFLAELQNLVNVAGEALKRLKLPDETNTEPEASKPEN